MEFHFGCAFSPHRLRPTWRVVLVVLVVLKLELVRYVSCHDGV